MDGWMGFGDRGGWIFEWLDFLDEWVALFWGEGMAVFRTNYACVRVREGQWKHFRSSMAFRTFPVH